MSRVRQLAVDARPGEIRACVMDGQGNPLEFAIDRLHAVSLVGATFIGRVKSVRAEIGAAFVDIGADLDGFLNFSRKDAPLTEGAAIAVAVDRDASEGKGPRLKRLDDVDASGPAPRSLAAAPGLPERLRAAEPDADWKDVPWADLEDAFAAVLDPVHVLPGGGRLIFSETPAMATVDVDAGGHRAASQTRLAAEVNLEAAAALGAALRLRRIGGIVAIDFLKMTAPRDRDAVLAALKKGLRDDPAETQVGVFSPFGVVELQRRRLGPSLASVMLSRDARLSDESTALMALDALCRRRGARAVLVLPPASAALLEGLLAAAVADARGRLGFDIEVRAVSHMAPGTFEIEDARER